MNIARFNYNLFTHRLESAQGLWFVKSEGVLKVTCSHVHFKVALFRKRR